VLEEGFERAEVLVVKLEGAGPSEELLLKEDTLEAPVDVDRRTTTVPVEEDLLAKNSERLSGMAGRETT